MNDLRRKDKKSCFGYFVNISKYFNLKGRASSIANSNQQNLLIIFSFKYSTTPVEKYLFFRSESWGPREAGPERI